VNLPLKIPPPFPKPQCVVLSFIPAQDAHRHLVRFREWAPFVKGWVRAETAFEDNNNKGPLEAGGAHAGPQAPRLLQGKERRKDSPCLCDSPQDCGSYLNKFTPSHCTRCTPHHHTRERGRKKRRGKRRGKKRRRRRRRRRIKRRRLAETYSRV
jgi:hypothetical protein